MIKTAAGHIALLAALLSVTPALAEEPVKVDPAKIPKLTEDNAPKKSLIDRLTGGDKADTIPFVDPAKTPPPKMKVPPVDSMPDIDAKPAPLPEVKAPEPELPPPAMPAGKPDLDMKKTAPIKGDKLVDERVETRKAQEKAAEKPRDEVMKDSPVPAEEQTGEKKSWRDYLPW